MRRFTLSTATTLLTGAGLAVAVIMLINRHMLHQAAHQVDKATSCLEGDVAAFTAELKRELLQLQLELSHKNCEGTANTAAAAAAAAEQGGVQEHAGVVAPVVAEPLLDQINGAVAMATGGGGGGGTRPGDGGGTEHSRHAGAPARRRGLNAQLWREYVARQPWATDPNVTEWWARSLGKGHSADWSGGQYVRGAVRLCEIPKVATKQFDIIFSNTGYRTKPLATKGGWEHPKGPGNHFNIVFYRDPLERFLSAYLDKCEGRNNLWEGHCEPVEVFGTIHPLPYYSCPPNEHNNTDGKRCHDSHKLRPELRLRLTDREAFEAYVQTFPLKWNVHFWPQSLSCHNNHKFAGEPYHFAGMINDTFREQIDRLTAMPDAPPGMAEAFRKTFAVKERKTNETEASKKVNQWITPWIAKMLVKYYAVDYMHLGIPLPDWLFDLPFPID